MNAQTPHTDPLTQAAIQNGAVLRTIAAAEAKLTSPGDVARAAGVATKNIARTMLALTTDGLVNLGGAGVYQLTATGERALQALDVWEGRAAASDNPGNDVLLLKYHQIRRNPLNARKLDLLGNPKHREELDGLKAQIVAAGDVLQNLVVFPADADGIHDLFAGERRWTAVGELIDEGQWDRDRPLRCLPRDNTPGQTAFISLVENSQVALSVLERARAYRTLCDDTGWSGREAALRTGWDVKSVQQYLQVLRDADPDHIAAHEAGDPDWTWELLRKSVQAPKDLEVQEPPQGDIEDHQLINPDGADGDRPTLPMIATMELTRSSARTCGGAGISLTVGQGYALCELVHKAQVQRVRAAGVIADLCYIAHDAGADRDFAILWRNGHITWGRAHDGRYVACVSDYGLARIADGGFPTGYVERTGYRTPWLREPSAEPVAPVARTPNPGPPRPEAEPLSPIALLALIELADKLSTETVEPTASSGKLAKVYKYWLDKTANDLRAGGLVEFTHGWHGGPHASLTYDGRAKLKAAGIDAGVVLFNELYNARLRAGIEAGRARDDAYVTPWLNETAADQVAGDPVQPLLKDGASAAGFGPADDDGDDESDWAYDSDILADVLSAIGGATPPAAVQILALLARLGIADPFFAGDGDDAGTVFSHGRGEVCTVDVNRGRSDPAARAVAELIAYALQQLVTDQGAPTQVPALLEIRPGDVAYTGGAHQYRILERNDYSGTLGFIVQAMANGKDHGKPRRLMISQFKSITKSEA